MVRHNDIRQALYVAVDMLAVQGANEEPAVEQIHENRPGFERARGDVVDAVSFRVAAFAKLAASFQGGACRGHCETVSGTGVLLKT